jgi:hypothetical protein
MCGFAYKSQRKLNVSQTPYFRSRRCTDSLTNPQQKLNISQIPLMFLEYHSHALHDDGPREAFDCVRPACIVIG